MDSKTDAVFVFESSHQCVRLVLVVQEGIFQSLGSVPVIHIVLEVLSTEIIEREQVTLVVKAVIELLLIFLLL